MTSADAASAAAETQPTVFLSYARADQKRARGVITALEQAGIKVWWDGLLEGGDTFLPTTEAALENADAVVVLWSKTSVESHWVRDEATRGRERQCLVPLRLDVSRPPLGFRQFQTIDLSRWRGKPDAVPIDSAIRAIRGFAGVHHHSAPKTPLVSRRTLLVGGAALVAATGGVATWRLFGAEAGEGNSIAVIPFANLGKADEAYFAAGLSEELRATLARDRQLRIAAPTSSAEFRDATSDVLAIAQKLSVAYILRGSVRHGADLLRVTVELLSGQDARLAWTRTIDRAPSEVLALQSEIAVEVSKALSAEINALSIAVGNSGDREQIGGTSSAKAFDAYLRGKTLVEASVSEETDRAALARFDEAIALDRNYAAALAARASALTSIASSTGQVSEIRKLNDGAVASAEAAIKAAPKLAGAHLALGFALLYGRLDLRGARVHCDRARAAGAGDTEILRPFALYCSFAGRAAEAEEAIGQVLRLDPLNPRAFRAGGFIALARRDYRGCEARMRQALALNPEIGSANYGIGAALYLQGRTAEAAAAFAAEQPGLFQLQGQAMAQRKLGKVDAAQQALKQMIAEFGDNSHYQQALVHAQWGEIEAGLAALEQAVAARDSGLLLAATDPLLDPLRRDSRFGALLSPIGLS